LNTPAPADFVEAHMRRLIIALLIPFTLQVSAAPPRGVAPVQAMPESPAAPKFTTFDAPGAGTGAFQGTAGFSINTAGAISGSYIAADNVSRAFLRASDGTFATFIAPHAGTGSGQGTIPISISSKAVVAGFYFDATTANHGFVRAADSTLTEFDAPGAGTAPHRGTIPLSINTAGTIAGAYDTGSAQTVTHWHGFVRTAKGKFTSFDAPGAGTGDKQGTQPPMSINSSGVITGTFTDANYVYHGFVRTAKGVMTPFDAPGAGKAPGHRKDLQFQGTIPIGINSKAVVTGVYSDASFVNHGFVRDAAGAITSFDIAGAGGSGTVGTVPFAINTAGTIAGLYQDNNGAFHGFVRTVTGTVTTFDVPGSGGGSLFQGTFAVSINTKGTIAGGFSDTNNVLHGFLRTPK
jgi:hypothetical protein